MEALKVMEALKEVEQLISSVEYGGLLGLMRDGRIEKITSDTDPRQLEKIIKAEELEDKIVEMMFGKKDLGTKEYSFMVRLMKLVHTRTPSPTKQRVQQRYRVKIVFKKGGADVFGELED